MDKQKLEIAARITAIEHVLMHVSSMAYFTSGVSAETITATRKNMRDQLLQQQTPGLRPGWSDHISGEIADHADFLMKGIAAMVGALETAAASPKT